MADPISFTLAAASAASSIGSGIAGMNQANDSAAAAEYNAASARQNAILARRQGEVDALNIRRGGAQILGLQRVGYAASGVSQDGSVLDVRAATAQNIETDALTAKYNAELKAIGYDRTAGLDSMQADNYREAGGWSLATGILGAVKPGIQAYGAF